MIQRPELDATQLHHSYWKARPIRHPDSQLALSAHQTEPLFNLLEVSQHTLDYLHMSEIYTLPFASMAFKKGLEQLRQQVHNDMDAFNQTLSRIGGLPVRMLAQDGSELRGIVAVANNYEFGQWGMTIRSDCAAEPVTIKRTLAQVREAYAATLLAQESELLD